MYLRRGRKITQPVAFDKYGIMRLAARIRDLKQKPYKMDIETTMIPIKSGRNIAQYKINAS